MAFFETKNITKFFGGLAAVNAVSFEVRTGRNLRFDRTERLG